MVRPHTIRAKPRLAISKHGCAVASPQGLKTYLPDLADIIGIGADTLHERMRALVRAKLLAAGAGRGPGSGVRATPRSIATLLISALGSETLADSLDRSKALARAKPIGGHCGLTNATSFLSALTVLLQDREKALRVHDVVISRKADHASITFLSPYKGEPTDTSDFQGRPRSQGGVNVVTIITAGVLSELARLTQRIGSPDNSNEESKP